MVAPAEHNERPQLGSFGDPIVRSHGSTWTERELRALKSAARYGSVQKVIRSLIDAKALESLIVKTEAAARSSHN